MARVNTACDPKELITLVRAGDLEVLDRVTQCHGARLMAVGRRYCKNEEDAADAVHDALISAGEHLHQFRGEGSVEGWLIRMVANACHRMRRGRKNDATLHDTEVVLVDDKTNPETLTHRGEIAIALGEALQQLSARDRTIVLLAEAEDWTGPQIAEELGMSPGAVRTRLSRARTRIRKHLQANLEDDLKD